MLPSTVPTSQSRSMLIISNLTWPAIWICQNVLLALLNKYVFRLGFDFPIMLSAVHMFVCSVLSYIAVKLEFIPTYPIISEDESKKLFNKLFLFSFLYILNIAFGNLSLKIVNIALSQVVRSVIPFVAMFLSFLILGSTFSFRLILSVIPLCLGVGLTVYRNQEFDIAAIVVLGVGIFLAALKGVMTSKYLSEYKSMHPVEFLMRICPLSCLLLLLLGSIQGETGRIMEKQFNEELDIFVWACVFLTGLMAFVLNWTNFIITRATSPLTVSVAGNIKQVVTVVLGIYLFSIPISWLNGLGIIVSILGLIFYSHTKLIEQENKENKIGKGTK